MQATLSVTTLADPIQTFGQLGGTGLITNKALAIPCHLGDPWNSVEYVTLAPSSSEMQTQVGEHRQLTDEVYFLVTGRGCLTTNGQQEIVEAGDLALAPQGTRHSLTNLSTEQPLSFLVVELKTPPDQGVHQPQLIKNMMGRLEEGAPFHGTRQSLHVARLDLAPFFAAPWGALSLLRIPPGEHVARYIVAEADELLFVVNAEEGCAIISVGEHTFRSHTKGIGMFAPLPNDGLSVVVPAGMTRSIRNDSTRQDNPLYILSLEVCRESAVEVDSTQQHYAEAVA